MRIKGYMNYDFFCGILPQLHEAGCRAIRFVRWGEPTLHPRFTEFVKATKKAGFLCHVNTNGQLFDEELIWAIIAYKLDSIKFSFQEYDRYGYERIRRGGSFDNLCKWIRHLAEKRGDGKCPFISVDTTSTKESNEGRESFRERFGDHVDAVTFGQTHRIGGSAQRGNQPRCWEFNKTSINWDSTVSFCCSDYDNLMLIGDLRKELLAEIWKGNKAIEYRKMLINKQHDLLPLCISCTDATNDE